MFRADVARELTGWVGRLRNPSSYDEPVTFDETLRFLTEQVGKSIDATVAVPIEGPEETRHIAGFSGQVEGTSLSGARGLPEAWNVWLKQTDGTPFAASFRLDRGLFERADVNANVPEAAEERGEFGTTWTLTIRQGGVVMSVEVYV